MLQASLLIGPHNENQFDELINWAIELAPNSLGFCLPHGDKSNYAMGLTSFEKVHKEMLRAFNIFHHSCPVKFRTSY